MALVLPRWQMLIWASSALKTVDRDVMVQISYSWTAGFRVLDQPLTQPDVPSEDIQPAPVIKALMWKGLGQMALWGLLHQSLTSMTIVIAFLWLPESFFPGHILLRDSWTAAGDSRCGSSGSGGTSHVLA